VLAPAAAIVLVVLGLTLASEPRREPAADATSAAAS
jgi:hypothetical protein